MGRRVKIDDAVVLEALASAGKPLSAYELIDRMGDGPKPTPPLIYRALERLIAVGNVHRLEASKRFVACSHQHHGHEVVLAVCSDCNGVTEIEDHGLCDLLDKWREAFDFLPTQRVFELVGRCHDCRTTALA